MSVKLELTRGCTEEVCAYLTVDNSVLCVRQLVLSSGLAVTRCRNSGVGVVRKGIVASASEELLV